MSVNEFNSKERMIAALNLEEPDYVPVAPYIWRQYIPKVNGLQISDWVLGDIETKVKLSIKAYQHYNYDWILTGANKPVNWKDHAIIKNYGDFYEVIETHQTNGNKSVWKLPIDETPPQEIGDLSLENLIETLEHEKTPFNELAVGSCYDFAQRLVEEVGNDVLVTGILGSPFGEVCCRLGLKPTIISLFRNPDLILEAVDLLTQSLIEQAKALHEVGIEALWIEEMFAGTDIISPSQFEKFSLPFAKKLVKELQKRSMKCIFYFCGAPMKILDSLLTIKADAYAFEEDKKGFKIDLGVIHEHTKNKACLFGNFDSLYTLRSTTNEVEENVKKMIRNLAPGGGFILGTGSPILKNVPIANIETFVRTAHRFGQYPIQI